MARPVELTAVFAAGSWIHITRVRFLGSIPKTSRERHWLPNYWADSHRFAIGCSNGSFSHEQEEEMFEKEDRFE
jgi:hypothetical protein